MPLPSPTPSAAPTIPLTDALRAAYQDLYNKYEIEIEAHANDPSVVQPLLDSQENVDDILTKDAMYRLHADSALFTALQDQIKTTSDELKTLKTQIAAIASKISTAGTIISAIDKVLSLAPGL